MKPFSEACEQNKQPILAVLRVEFADCTRVLEIGSGTGQHAVYFSKHLPQLIWQASDLAENLAGIQAWLNDAGHPNTLDPIALDAAHGSWPTEPYDGVFSANTAHIMSWEQVQAMFHGVDKVLGENGVFCLYGPFNYNGSYTSESNAQFDTWLKARDPASGIRDITALHALATELNWSFCNDYAMPVNNRTLVWRKIPS